MGAGERTSRFAESPCTGHRVARLELLALWAFCSSACTAAGDYEPTFVGAAGSSGVAGSAASESGQGSEGNPRPPGPVLAPGEGAAPIDLFPGDPVDESTGGTRTGAGGVVRDAGPDASDAGDGGDAGAGEPDGEGGDASAPSDDPDAGAPPNRDAGAPANAADASPPPNAPDASPPPSEPCPGLVFEDSCYEFFDEEVSWSEAEARCVAWGGHLASVESAVEDAFIGAWPALLGVPPLNGSGLWLGGTDAPADGNFRWVADRPLSFAGWASDQPNNGVGVDCIEKRNDATQRWYDRRCTDSERYVCERPE